MLNCMYDERSNGVIVSEAAEAPAEGKRSASTPTRPSVVVCVVGSCSDQQLFCRTVDAVFEQDYAGQIVTMVPRGAKLKRRWALRSDADHTRLMISSAATAELELGARGILAAVPKLRPVADFIVLLRCGERPQAKWLQSLLQAQDDFDADVVAGPVKAIFDEPPLDWIVADGLFDRLGAGGSPVHFVPAADNVLIRTDTFRMLAPLVFSGSTAGEGDWIEFVHRASALGLISVWANDAIVFDVVSKARMREDDLINCEFARAYARARTKSAMMNRLNETLWRVRALGVVMAGFIAARKSRGGETRALRARLIAARARGVNAARSRVLRRGKSAS